MIESCRADVDEPHENDERRELGPIRRIEGG
jgi:hypothetical protein